MASQRQIEDDAWQAFAEYARKELPNVWRLLDPSTRDMYSKAWRRGYAKGRSDAIEYQMVRTDPDGSYRP